MSTENVKRLRGRPKKVHPLMISKDGIELSSKIKPYQHIEQSLIGIENVIDFFRRMTGLEPTDYQKEFLYDATNPDVKKIIESAGRQSGKTLCAAIAGMWWVFCYPESVNIMLLSAQENNLYLHMRDAFRKNPELWKRLTPRSQLAKDLIPIKGFESKNGSIVFVKNATDKQIRGTPINILFVDEACNVSNDNILTAIGCITGKLAKIIMLSTPDVDNSLFVRWVNNPEPLNWKVCHWSSENLSWHDKEVDRVKEVEYTAQKYATEVLGRPKTTEERAFFSRKNVDSCVFEIEPIKEGGIKSITVAGIDWGFHDPTVLIILELISNYKKKVLFAKEWIEQPIEAYAQEIAKILASYKVSIVKADAQPLEYKGKIEKFTRIRVVYYDGRTEHKDQELGQLQRLIREHRLIVPVQFKKLIDQLIKYRREAGRNDDYVDALSLANYEPPISPDSVHSRVRFPRIDGGLRYGNKYGRR